MSCMQKETISIPSNIKISSAINSAIYNLRSLKASFISVYVYILCAWKINMEKMETNSMDEVAMILLIFS